MGSYLLRCSLEIADGYLNDKFEPWIMGYERGILSGYGPIYKQTFAQEYQDFGFLEDDI